MTDQRHYTPKSSRCGSARSKRSWPTRPTKTSRSSRSASRPKHSKRRWPPQAHRVPHRSSNPGHPCRLHRADSQIAPQPMLLILLYGTAAHVGKIIILTLCDLCLTEPGHILLTSKQQDPRRTSHHKTIKHLHVYLDEFHPNITKLPMTMPFFYSLRHSQPTKLSVDTVPAVLQQAAHSARAQCPFDSTEHPLPPDAQNQSDQSLPAGFPPAHHHASPRSLKLFHHSCFLCLCDPRHNTANDQRHHPPHQHPGHLTAHRRPNPNPFPSPIAPKH